MISALRTLPAFVCAALVGCGGGSTPPTQRSLPPAPSPATPISGREHIGWTQADQSIAGYVFLLYVDSARHELPQASCSSSSSSPGTLDCDSPLPTLTNGTHTREQLMPHSHTHLISSLKELPALVMGDRASTHRPA